MAAAPTDPAALQGGAASRGEPSAPAAAPTDPAPPQDGTAPRSGFAAATAVTPLGGGRYGAIFDAGWSTVAGVNGGIIMATLIRAIEAEIGVERGVRSLQCQFLRPPKVHEATISVEILRSGARATNLRLRLQQDGRTLVEALATCFRPGLRELATWSPPMPQVAPPTDHATAPDDPRNPSVAQHLLYRPRIGPPPLQGTPLAPGEPARTGGWLELVEPHPVDHALLAFFVDAWWPAALGPIDRVAFNPSVDLAFHVRTALPSAGLPHQPLLLDVLTQASAEGLVDEDARLFSADGVLLAQARQLAITLTPDDRPLVTRGAQPSTGQRR